MPKRDLPSSPTQQTSSMEKEEPKDEGVAEPGVNDVISGRGDTINRHPGNVQFRQMVEEKRRVYLSSHFKREKRLIAETIVTTIETKGGRFLSRDSRTGLWFSIGWDRAREKASQALRENSKKMRLEIQKTDVQRRRDTAVASSSSSSLYRYPAFHLSGGAKPATSGHFDAHHYPYPATGAAWGYPYYYGYGAHHQVPPYPPPVYAYPPPPPMALPHFGGGYTDVVSFGGGSQASTVAATHAPSFKQDRLQRKESDEHMDSSGSSVELGQDDDAEEEDYEPNAIEEHEVRIEDALDMTGSRSNSTAHRRVVSEQQERQEREPSSSAYHKQQHSFPGFPPPAFPCLNLTTDLLTDQTPRKHSNQQPPKSPRDRPSPILPIQYRGSTPDSMTHKLAASPPSSYTIRSPHFGNAPLLRGGPFSHHYQQGSTLTPRENGGASALDEILASPVTDEGSSMGEYTGSHSSNNMDSPLGSSPCSRDSIPFSPIQAHLDHTLKGHPQLKPRPFYR